MNVVELRPEEFTDRLLPIFMSVAMRLNAEGYPVIPSPAYFFPHWRKLMEMGLARTWEIPGAVAGVLFVPNMFTAEPEALICFWFSLPDTSGTIELLKAVEAAAKESHCLNLRSAAFGVLRGSAMERLYKSLGFKCVETGWSKKL